MTARRNGWITARSQIAFVVGLVLAVGVIFWLELIQFRNADDPSGDAWVMEVALPEPRAVTDTPPLWLATAIAIVANSEDHSARVVVAAACHAFGGCPDGAGDVGVSLAELAGSPVPWSDAPDGPLTFAALTALASSAVGEALPAWAAAWNAVALISDGSITDRDGLRQFTGRALALAGRDAPARRYADLRQIFEPADGLKRIGNARAVDLATGLGLLVATFPETGAARQLLWQTYLAWPTSLAETPVELIALWWSAFTVPGLETELGARIAGAAPMAAAIAVLAATTAGRAPLLNGG